MYGPELVKNTKIAERYILKEFKGSGSFGEVWLAEDLVLGINVAVKLYISLDQNGQEEFKDEYKVAYGLSHENLLTAQYYSIWNHRPYLIMKYCAKGSSGQYAGNMTESEIWKFIHDVSNGLKYLHSQEPPIVHQDIKPENILLDEQGNYLITDFGISKKMRTTMRKQSKRSIESGAIAYMGPERFLKDPMAVKASDIWSLGVSIYELATNDLPFMGQGGGMLNAGAALPELNHEKYSNSLNEVLQACLAKETWDRPTAEDLEEYTSLRLKGNDISFSQWRKGPTPPPKPNKWIIPLLVGVVLIGAIAFIMSNRGNNNELIEQRYLNIKTLCENDIKIGGADNYISLLEARALLDSLDAYHSKYSFISNKFEGTSSLGKALSDKIDDAQKAWVRSAKGQYEVAEDIPTAISYYHIAALLNPSNSVISALSTIANQSGCKGAYMVISKVLIDNNQLIIIYNGVNQSELSDVTLTYEISSDNSSNVVRGQSNIRIQVGTNKRLIINLSDTPATTQNQIILKNNNVVFFKGKIGR